MLPISPKLFHPFLSCLAIHSIAFYRISFWVNGPKYPCIIWHVTHPFLPDCSLQAWGRPHGRACFQRVVVAGVPGFRTVVARRPCGHACLPPQALERPCLPLELPASSHVGRGYSWRPTVCPALALRGGPPPSIPRLRYEVGRVGCSVRDKGERDELQAK